MTEVTEATEVAEPESGRASPVAREFATGLLRTRIDGTREHGFVWRRSNGPLSPAPFVTVTTTGTTTGTVTGAQLRDLKAPGTVRWAWGVPDGPGGDARVYRARGPESVAGRLLREGPYEGLPGTLRGLGGALRQLHERPAPTAAPLSGRPRGLDRFDLWLGGRSPSPRAAYAESFLRPRIGDEGLGRLRALSASLDGRDGGREVVLSHGAPSLGSLIPAVLADGDSSADSSGDGADGPGDGTGDGTGAADMLVGEDLCLAPWQFDVGWTLGELVELNWFRGTDDSAAWSAVLDAFFEGYGRTLGDAWRDHAAFRVLLHLHDYTAYVDWNERTVERYIGFAKFLLGV